MTDTPLPFYTNPDVFTKPEQSGGEWFRSCKHCTVHLPVCHVCKNDRITHELPPGYGSYDARYPLRTCETCHNKIMRAVFVAAGREAICKVDENGVWRD